MFRRAKNTDTRRARQAVSPGQNAARAVFSYHASRSVRGTDAAGGQRSASSIPWLGASKPASPRKQAGSWPRRARIVGAILLVLTILIYGVSLSGSPRVVPLADTATQQVFLRSADVYQRAAKAALGKSLGSTNKLTIDTAQIAKDMQQQFPELERVTIALPFFGRTPVVYIQPAQPALLLRVTQGGVFVMDTSGRALINASEAHRIAQLGLPVVEDESGLPVTLGRTALPSGNVAFITEVVGQMKARKITITDMTLPKGTSELDVHINGEAYVVKYNLRGDARAEAGAFMAVKAYLEREHKTPGTYIDVRADNKAYYR